MQIGFVADPVRVDAPLHFVDTVHPRQEVAQLDVDVTIGLVGEAARFQAACAGQRGGPVGRDRHAG